MSIQSRMTQAGMPNVSWVAYNKRDSVLKGEGFVWWERFWLAQHSISGPAVREWRRQRAEEWEHYRATYPGKGSRRNLEMAIAWRKDLSATYRRRGWVFNDGTLNPFKAIDDLQPQTAVTPQAKRRSNATRDFIRYKDQAKRQRKTGHGQNYKGV